MATLLRQWLLASLATTILAITPHTPPSRSEAAWGWQEQVAAARSRRALYGLRGVERYAAFHDTSKPNALIVYPVSDAVGAFKNRCARQFLEWVREEYDTKILVAGREGELYFALDTTSDIHLVIIGGHGSTSQLTFTGGDPMQGASAGDEEYALDLSDEELGSHLGNVAPEGVIFLYSCANGQGGERANNLANMVMRLASGRTVYSATLRFACSDIHVRNMRPFDIWIGDTTHYTRLHPFLDFSHLDPEALERTPAEEERARREWRKMLKERERDITYTNRATAGTASNITVRTSAREKGDL